MLGGPQGRSGQAENLAPPGFDPGPSSPQTVAIPTELPGPYKKNIYTYIRVFYIYIYIYIYIYTNTHTHTHN